MGNGLEGIGGIQGDPGSYTNPVPIEGATVSSGAPSSLGSVLGGGIGMLAGGIFGGLGNVVSGLFNQSSANAQMRFQERMANTQHQREVADLRAAGLNPMLSARLGGNASPPGASATMPAPGGDMATAAMSTAKMMAVDLPALESTLRLQSAQADAAQAQGEAARARAAADLQSLPGIAMEPQVKRANIHQIEALIGPEAQRASAQARLANANAQLVPATARQLQASTDESRARAAYTAAGMGEREYNSSNLGLTIKALGDVTGAVGNIFPKLNLGNTFGGQNSAGSFRRGLQGNGRGRVIPERNIDPTNRMD